MNLRIFFDPIPSDICNHDYHPGAMSFQINAYQNQSFPDWKSADIAIIGLSEDRGTPLNTNIHEGANEIRKKLYALFANSRLPYRIVDLGNLRCGVNLSESYLRMKELGEQLLQHHTFAIFVGGGHDMDFGQFLSYESNGNLINIANIDAQLDMYADDYKGQNQSHIHKILTYEPNYIFHYCHLAYQSYLCGDDSINVLEKLHFESYRLGFIKNNIEDIEPAIRNADMLTFDFGAINGMYAQANKYKIPFGLSPEEACQICWYAGLSNRLSSAGFYEYNPNIDQDGQSAILLATMIWYLIEGYYHRSSNLNFESAEYTKYTVTMHNNPHQIIFFKHNKSEKWWMQVPHPFNKNKYHNSTIVPCSYHDYQLANKGEVPNRWILAHAKFI
jgi:formiminoglutamase